LTYQERSSISRMIVTRTHLIPSHPHLVSNTWSVEAWLPHFTSRYPRCADRWASLFATCAVQETVALDRHLVTCAQGSNDTHTIAHLYKVRIGNRMTEVISLTQVATLFHHRGTEDTEDGYDLRCCRET